MSGEGAAVDVAATCERVLAEARDEHRLTQPSIPFERVCACGAQVETYRGQRAHVDKAIAEALAAALAPVVEGAAEQHACQVVNPSRKFPCPYRESGGRQCERLDDHDDDSHWFSAHTIEHDRLGNGYACSAIGLTGDLS